MFSTFIRYFQATLFLLWVCAFGACYRTASNPISSDNTCSPSNINGLCSGNELCVNGYCVPLTSDNTCSITRPNGLCADGLTCSAGVCVSVNQPQCSNVNLTGACPTQQACINGACRAPDCSPQYPFGACEINQACNNGVCEIVPCSPTHLNGKCPEQQKCSSAGTCINTNACVASVDCPPNAPRCGSNGLCLAPLVCANNADCADYPHHQCSNQICVRDYTCSNNTDCLSGTEYCASNKTCLPQGVCNVNADCADGQRCSVSQTCISENSCNHDNRNCALTEYCSQANQCIDRNQCLVSADCTFGQECLNQQCIIPTNRVCTQDADCSATERCSGAGGCIPSNRCIDNTDCLSNFSCNLQNNTCTPNHLCTQDQDCASNQYCSVLRGCVPFEACATDADCLTGESCAADFTCRPSNQCGAIEFRTQLIQPDVLIVFDRSGSMNECTTRNDPSTTRWNSALTALETLVSTYDQQVRFGLTLFPKHCAQPLSSGCTQTCNAGSCQNWCDRYVNNCSVGTLDVPIHNQSGSSIMTWLQQESPGGHTPTGATLHTILNQANNFGLLQNTSDNTQHDKYILLVTDGDASSQNICSENGPNPIEYVNTALDGLQQLASHVKTFVVGFGTDGLAQNLNCHAVHGGTSQCDTTITVDNCSTATSACYYPTNDTESLSQAFAEIAGQVVSCEYELEQVPQNINRLYVYLKKAGTQTKLSRDTQHVAGWDYTQNQTHIMLYGSPCQQVKQQQASIQVLYGCQTSSTDG